MNDIVKSGGEILAFLLIGIVLLFIPWVGLENKYIDFSNISLIIKVMFSLFGLLFLFISYKFYQKIFDNNSKISSTEVPEELIENLAFQDVSFWYESFNKLPFPVFIKEFNRGNEQNEHIIINKAMRDFESSDFENKRFHGEIDKRLKDYVEGDTITYEKGFFKQIELCMNMEEGIKPSTILTIKNLLIHKGKNYIIGAYIPIEPKRISRKNTYKIKYSNGQLVLPISESNKSDHTIDVKIGDAIKEKIENDFKNE